MPKARSISLTAEEMAEESPLHGAINEDEAKLYVQSVDDIFNNMAKNIKEGMENAMEVAITALKQAMEKVIPGTEEAVTGSILKAIWDPTCLAIQRQTEEVEAKLEELMPDEDIPESKNIIQDNGKIEELTEQQRQDISEVFKNLDVAHEHLAKSCSLMGVLSQTLSSRQLLLLMKASIRPLVQIITLAGLLDDPKRSGKKRDLPENTADRVKVTMVPMPAAETIKKERVNSPTRLLATTLAFRIIRKFTDGTTQHSMQDTYSVKPKQLALYILGQKYLGGTDRLAKKWKVTGDEPEPSTSK